MKYLPDQWVRNDATSPNLFKVTANELKSSDFELGPKLSKTHFVIVCNHMDCIAPPHGGGLQSRTRQGLSLKRFLFMEMDLSERFISASQMTCSRNDGQHQGFRLSALVENAFLIPNTTVRSSWIYLLDVPKRNDISSLIISHMLMGALEAP